MKCGYCGIPMVGARLEVCGACMPAAIDGAFAGVNRETYAATTARQCQNCGEQHIAAGCDPLCQKCRPFRLEWMMSGYRVGQCTQQDTEK